MDWLIGLRLVKDWWIVRYWFGPPIGNACACQLVTIQFLLLALIDLWRGHLVIVIWSVWHWIGGLVMD